MHRCLGIDVIKGKQCIVLIQFVGRDFTGELFVGDQFTTSQIDLTIGGNVMKITRGQFDHFLVSELNFLNGRYALELVSTPFKQATNLSVSIDRYIDGQLGLTNINGSLSFGEHLAVIGDNLFRGCLTNPIDLTIPDNVKKIKNSAFQNCTGITSISLGSGLTEIGSNAFEGCTGITSVTIPDAVTTLGQSAFSGCTSLTTATIGMSVDIVRNDTFNGCSALESVDMPDGIVTIGNNAFNGCSALKQITIPGSVTSVGQNAFNGCQSMRTVIFAEGDAELMLMETPFNGCIVLGQLDLGRNLMSDIKFGLESSLHTLNISDNVKFIGDNAFKNYTSLSTISIGSGLEYSGMDAFAGCPVSQVHVSDIGKWCAIDFANTNANPASISCTIYLNNSVVENLEIPDDVVEVKPFVFYNNLAKMVKFGSNVKKIGQSAFDNNTELGIVVFNNIHKPCVLIETAVAWSIIDSVLGLPAVNWADRLYEQRNNYGNLLEHWALDLTSGDSAEETPLSHKQEDYTGIYENPGHGPIRISFGKDGWICEYRGVNQKMEHCFYDTFRVPDVKMDTLLVTAPLTFIAGDDVS